MVGIHATEIPDPISIFVNPNRKQRNLVFEWSSYSGWKKKQFSATGYFRTENDGKRSWLIDPDGFAFYSNGLDCVHPHEMFSYIDGMEKFLTWLPEKEGKFRDAWYLVDQRTGSYENDTDEFDFAISNLIRAFGKDWHVNWEKITRNRLIDWEFNTVAK